MSTLLKLMKDEDCSVLLCTHLYENPEENTSPPHHIDLKDVEQLFGEKEVKILNYVIELNLIFFIKIVLQDLRVTSRCWKTAWPVWSPSSRGGRTPMTASSASNPVSRRGINNIKQYCFC